MKYLIYNKPIVGEEDMDKYILAIDIGGSKYMVGLISVCGEILEVRSFKWKLLTKKDVIRSIILSSRELLDKYKDISPISIGITIPGLADPKQGMWVESSFSGIKDINIGPIMEEKFKIPVYIDNDGQACALAEKLFGSCKDTSDFFYMTISNGIGGAIFLNNTIYYGGFGNAGEIGHTVVVEDGLQCKCGNKGCLEVHAAGPAITRNYLELGGNNKYQGNDIEAKYIADLAYKKDRIAIKTFELEGYYIGKVLAQVCNILNPQKVIIGGGVSLAFSLFEFSLWKSLNSFLYKSANRHLKIEPSQLGYNGGIMGATAVAICGEDNRYGWALNNFKTKE